MQKSVLHDYQKSSSFDQVVRQFLMQDRHERDRTESVMLDPAFQTSWVMEKLHDKSRILPDPDIFTSDNNTRWESPDNAACTSGMQEKNYVSRSVNL